MFISGYDIEKRESVWLKAEFIVRIHKMEPDDMCPILETVDGRMYEVESPEEIEKVMELVGLRKEKPVPASITLEKMNLGTRSFNILYRNGIRNMQEILDLGKRRVKALRNMGSKSMEEIEKCLKDYGMDWK